MNEAQRLVGARTRAEDQGRRRAMPLLMHREHAAKSEEQVGRGDVDAKRRVGGCENNQASGR